jgi:hypothetical protein
VDALRLHVVQRAASQHGRRIAGLLRVIAEPSDDGPVFRWRLQAFDFE